MGLIPPPPVFSLETAPSRRDLLSMRRQRQTDQDHDHETVWAVEILPAEPNSRSGPATPPGSSLMRSVISIAVVAGVIGLLALMLAFAATVALIAVPVAIGAGLIAWLGMKWRAARGR